ncbi:MAG: MFS transporter [Candidatus Micrarchaeaceae archaeon]
MDKIKNIEDSRFALSRLSIMLISGISFFTDAYDLFVIGIVLLIVKDIFSLSAIQIGMLASVALFGAAVGSIAFGYLGDRLGRRYTYWLTISILIIAAIGSSLSFDFTQLLLWRLLLGIGIGGDYPLSATIVAEYASKDSRGKLVASTFAMQGFGIIAGGVLAVGLLAANLPMDWIWRILLAAGAIPTIAILYSRSKLSETPWYSAYQKARKGRKRVVASITFGELWANNHKYIIGSALAWFLLDISYYGTTIFTPYLATFFGFSGIFGPSLASALILIIAAIPGYWVAVWLIDKEGRKPMQAIGFLAMALLFITLAIFGKGMLAYMPVAFFSLYGLTFFFSNYGPNMTTYVYPVELYPTQFRARGHGFAATSGKIGAALSTLLFPLLIAYFGEFSVMALLGAVALCGFAATMLLLPETKKRSLLETSGESALLLITDILYSKFESMLEHIGKGMRLLRMRMDSKLSNKDFADGAKREEHYCDIDARSILDGMLDSKLNSIVYYDISHLAKRLDDVMDGIEEVAARFLIYDMKGSGKDMQEMVEATAVCIKDLTESMALLANIQFDPNALKALSSIAKDASKYENVADTVFRKSLHDAIKGSRNMKNVIATKEVYEAIESISDRCMDVIDIENDIALRYAYSKKLIKN